MACSHCQRNRRWDTFFSTVILEVGGTLLRPEFASVVSTCGVFAGKRVIHSTTSTLLNPARAQHQYRCALGYVDGSRSVIICIKVGDVFSVGFMLRFMYEPAYLHTSTEPVGMPNDSPHTPQTPCLALQKRLIRQSSSIKKQQLDVCFLLSLEDNPDREKYPSQTIV